jgi:hypothetical protein
MQCTKETPALLNMKYTRYWLFRSSVFNIYIYIFMLRWKIVVSLTVHLSITLANDQFDAQIFNTFITFLYMYMFRAISCSSSGGQIAFIQHLVSSLPVSDRPVHRLRKNSFSTCAPDGHLLRVKIPDALLIQIDRPMMCKVLLETCTFRGL